MDVETSDVRDGPALAAAIARALARYRIASAKPRSLLPTGLNSRD